jgi:2-keto-4-pentenoate hydratase/2-oxohepta-3-ene-1,7-dioic acid hydratase in catechol pathway
VRFVSFECDGVGGYGVIDGETVVDLTQAGSNSLRAALAAEGMDGLKRRVAQGGPQRPLAAVRLLPPIPDPLKIICAGLNYRAHAEETGAGLPKKPPIFTRFISTIVAPGAAIVRPAVSVAFDFEGELAVVIGKTGWRIPEADALDYVAGYSCFGDNSIRDFQRHTPMVTPGKNFDRSGSFGPWLVPADEVGDPAGLNLETRLNGTVVQHTSVSDLIFSVPELIAYISSFTRLEAGDVIATGTPSGVGAARNPPLWMRAGDTLEIEISGLGVLRNPVIDEPAAAWGDRIPL